VPAFIQAKKTGDVCFLTDLRRLNAQINLLSHTIGFGIAEVVYYHITLGQIPIKKITNGCENKPRYIPKDYV
jgi:hypothetical protein